ncbi:hypothetical protein QBC46DRAFT_409059 [Diplogelasinospora grovesii]|uniref:Uncharacterized protein n=1 Tax=Diplogelasinospora grovesii TaxID=303347 RepID=A0AAN6S4G0_9PEZI|nr:hypothetical protein QBC46DRAFT_409059 [Diplogelasinospora grovesii]
MQKLEGENKRLQEMLKKRAEEEIQKQEQFKQHVSLGKEAQQRLEDESTREQIEKEREDVRRLENEKVDRMPARDKTREGEADAKRNIAKFYPRLKSTHTEAGIRDKWVKGTGSRGKSSVSREGEANRREAGSELLKRQQDNKQFSGGEKSTLVEFENKRQQKDDLKPPAELQEDNSILLPCDMGKDVVRNRRSKGNPSARHLCAQTGEYVLGSLNIGKAYPLHR